MDECCRVITVPERQRPVFLAVLWINVTMFLADSVDMLGDAIVYGFSLYVVGRGTVWQTRAALLKGVIMAAFGAGVLAQVVIKISHGLAPNAEVMGIIGVVALAANVWCLMLLWRHRGDDINMRSAWVCSRNDVIGNVGCCLSPLQSPSPVPRGLTFWSAYLSPWFSAPRRSRLSVTHRGSFSSQIDATYGSH